MEIIEMLGSFWLLAGLIAIAIVYYYFKNKSNRANLPPGPMGLPLLGYIPFLGRNPFHNLGQLSKKYGDIFSLYLGTNRTVFLNSADSIREACKLKDLCGRPKSELSLLWSGCGTDQCHGILTNDGEEWSEQRRFAAKHLKNLGIHGSVMENLIYDEVQDFVDRHRPKVNQAVDLSSEFQLAVINSLWGLIAGRRFRHDDPDFLHVVQCAKKTLEANSTGVAFIFPLLAKMFPKLTGWAQLESNIGLLDYFVQQQVEEQRRSKNSVSNNLISLYLNKIHTCSDPSSSFYGEKGEKSMRAAIMDLFMAGVDTSSNALSWACLYLSSCPRVQEKAREEVDRVIGHRQARGPDRSRMPYMEAVIHEVLRLCCVVPLLLPHRATKATELGGFTLPEGTWIMFNAYHVMKDHNNWDKPDKFIPERFISKNGSFNNHDAFLAFGAGKRNCLGENLGRIQMFLFLAVILQNFVIEFPQGQSPAMEFASPGIVLHPPAYDLILRSRRA